MALVQLHIGAHPHPAGTLGSHHDRDGEAHHHGGRPQGTSTLSEIETPEICCREAFCATFFVLACVFSDRLWRDRDSLLLALGVLAVMRALRGRTFCNHVAVFVGAVSAP